MFFDKLLKPGYVMIMPKEIPILNVFHGYLPVNVSSKSGMNTEYVTKGYVYLFLDCIKEQR